MSTASPRVYLLDVEGTVAPVSFVYEQLFPYARTHFESFLRKNVADQGREMDFSEGSFFWDLMLLKLENEAETDAGAPRILPEQAVGPRAVGGSSVVSMSPAFGIPRILNYIFWLMDHDRKSTALKSLQGKIWKSGFESGELRGTLFPDVPDALRRWAACADVSIYSSGSVEAQQLVFRHSTFGDLTPLIAAYFDTRTGPKRASASYVAISSAMNVVPGELLFLSDVVQELDAARQAGCQTLLVVREGNAPVNDAHGHPAVESFAAL
jgi:enolase-phosphatase E1